MTKAEGNAIYDDMLDAPPEPWELEALAAKLAVARLPAQPPVSVKSDDLAVVAQRARRLQERWERTMANVLRRYWDRRQSLMLTKIRSVQFRRGTPLWDPPGDTPVSSRYSLLVDEAAWDRELTEDMTNALRDLYAEAVESLEISEAKDDRPDIAEFIKRWITYTLTFNRAAAAAVRRILDAEPTRVEDLEEEVRTHIAATADIVGDRIATSLSTGAVNQAQEEAARRQAGAVQKIWFSSQDGKVRDTHRAVAGQTVPVGESFTVRDSKGIQHSMRHPGDISAPKSLWLNCRCLCLFTFDHSGDLWRRPDGSPLDPYGRMGTDVEPKSFAPSDLGIKSLG